MSRQKKIPWRLSRAAFLMPAATLAPLLLAQGLYVRRVTPRLPEPPGERSGVAGTGTTLRLLIVGDSAAAGVGASAQSQALSGCLITQLAHDHQVHWQLSAQSGFETRDIHAHLHEVPDAPFDIAVVSIGVNDVIGGVRSTVWQERLRALAELLGRRFAVRHILFSPLPPMHCFTALPQPLRWCLGLRAKRFNHLLAQFVAANPSCHLTDLDYPLDPGYLADDGFHPGERAYAFWAERIAEQVREVTL